MMRAGNLVDNYDQVNGHTEQVRQNHKIIDGRHGIAAHPFEDRLWCVESAYSLYIAILSPLALSKDLIFAPVAAMLIVVAVEIAVVTDDI